MLVAFSMFWSGCPPIIPSKDPVNLKPLWWGEEASLQRKKFHLVHKQSDCESVCVQNEDEWNTASLTSGQNHFEDASTSRSTVTHSRSSPPMGAQIGTSAFCFCFSFNLQLRHDVSDSMKMCLQTISRLHSAAEEQTGAFQLFHYGVTFSLNFTWWIDCSIL